ncbi:MAG: nicotinate phosphoribosyltransferase [Bacteroidetes bacterium]|nr:nicotinate phosphoribosyltransferase [Bacteroidota bacterium]
MISSILDNDFYKFTMQNAVIKMFPRAIVRYEFINRDNTKFPDGFDNELKTYINNMSKLRLTPSEQQFLSEKYYFLPPTYVDFLKGYVYNPDEVSVSMKNGELKIFIEGYWYRTILWEVPLLAIVSELYFIKTKQKIFDKNKIIDIARQKALRFNKLGVKVADFGTRRRFSFNNQDLIVREMSNYGKEAFTGTSNVILAKKHNISAIGTHAHEWFMFHSAKYGYKMANKLSLEHWVDIYRGDLGIALSDTFTSPVFFKDFDTKLAKLFDGIRQDSGDPLKFADKTINHYKKLNINPLSKTIIFSDSLNPDKVEEIANYCKDKIKISFGIGTNLTNDVGVRPLNIVIKMTGAKPEGQNWINTIKLSDDLGKITGENNAIKLCKDVLGIKH